MTTAQNAFPRPYMQNRELSWLDFDERVLDQGSDRSVPLLERLNFVSIFWSNLQEFFMVRVGSLNDLSLVKKPIYDTKTGMTPQEQLDAIYERCHKLYPVQEHVYEVLRGELAQKGVKELRPNELTPEQKEFVDEYFEANVEPFLSPQIVNSRHPFPHLENGELYVVVRLDEKADEETPAKAAKTAKKNKKAKGDKNLGAEGVTLGLIPMPRRTDRMIKLPGDDFSFILLEHVIETHAEQVFSMYRVKHSNIICVTRNADIDVNEGVDEAEDADYREFMKRLLKKRGRLAPVRLELAHPIDSKMMEKFLFKRLSLKKNQAFVTTVPLDMSFTWGIGAKLPRKVARELLNEPFVPQWTAMLDGTKPIMPQLQKGDVVMSYPYESMDPFIQLLREAAVDPSVISIKITLYRLASQSHLAEALIAAAENGKQVTALFELRARFDESNNIEWSQRFEEAGCNVIYGFRDYKVHSKICCITRQTPNGLGYITQLGTGNYNEKTAKLYTDFSFITCDEAFGKDAARFFHNMSLENVSNDYDVLRVAPLQIKPMLLLLADKEIEKARRGEPCGMFFKTNSVTDVDVIEKIAEASQAGVPVTLLVRGISCILPGVAGYTDNVRVVSIVGRLLEHSRIYAFGSGDDRRFYLSSADLMTRNMDKRIEIAWPVLDPVCKERIVDFIDICLSDNAKLRELKPDGRYTTLSAIQKDDPNRCEAHEILIKQAVEAHVRSAEKYAAERARKRHDNAAEETSGARAQDAAAGMDEESGDAGARPVGDFAQHAAASARRMAEVVQDVASQAAKKADSFAAGDGSKPQYVRARIIEDGASRAKDIIVKAAPVVEEAAASVKKKGLGFFARLFRR